MDRQTDRKYLEQDFEKQNRSQIKNNFFFFFFSFFFFFFFFCYPSRKENKRRLEKEWSSTPVDGIEGFI